MINNVCDMENNNKPMPITFREGRNQNYIEWKQDFDNLESLRNYLRIKMIKIISLRVFVQPLDKTITLKSYVSPSDLTAENYRWLQESRLPGDKFIMVNHRVC
jgi:hypothetical protein